MEREEPFPIQTCEGKQQCRAAAARRTFIDTTQTEEGRIWRRSSSVCARRLCALLRGQQGIWLGLDNCRNDFGSGVCQKYMFTVDIT